MHKPQSPPLQLGAALQYDDTECLLVTLPLTVKEKTASQDAPPPLKGLVDLPPLDQPLLPVTGGVGHTVAHQGLLVVFHSVI